MNFTVDRKTESSLDIMLTRMTTKTILGQANYEEWLELAIRVELRTYLP